jgi:hypothetical protein
LPTGRSIEEVLEGITVHKGDDGVSVQWIAVDSKRRSLAETVPLARKMCREVDIDVAKLDAWYESVKDRARSSTNMFSHSNNKGNPSVSVDVRRVIGEGDTWFVLLEFFWK